MGKQWKERKSVTVRYKPSDTNVPILVPCDPRNHDGIATFLAYSLGDVCVRVLGPGDFHEMAFKALGTKAQRELRELIALRQGLAVKEEPSVWVGRLLWNKPKEKRMGRKVAVALRRDIQKLGHPSMRTERLMGGTRLHGDPLRFLSVALSKKLSEARLVLWWKGEPRPLRPFRHDDVELRDRIAHFLHWRRKEYVPAVFCPDMETAFYVYVMFTFTGKGLAICQECGEVFQKPHPDSMYCCFSHGEAYRIRRWRETQRQKKKTGKA
jgi:hypothetical protein